MPSGPPKPPPRHRFLSNFGTHFAFILKVFFVCLRVLNSCTPHSVAFPQSCSRRSGFLSLLACFNGLLKSSVDDWTKNDCILSLSAKTYRYSFHRYNFGSDTIVRRHWRWHAMIAQKQVLQNISMTIRSVTHCTATSSKRLFKSRSQIGNVSLFASLATWVSFLVTCGRSHIAQT